MSKFIFENATRYNTADLEKLFDALYIYAKTGVPGFLGSRWAGCTWLLGVENLPINISNWSGYDPVEVTGFRRVRTYTPMWQSTSAKVEGPWFCEREKKNPLQKQGVHRRLQILSPDALCAVISPMEALAGTMHDVLPREATVQVLYRASKYMGIGLRPPHHQTGNFTRSDDLLLLHFIRALVVAMDLTVRIERGKQSKKKKPRRPTEERIQRLLQVYMAGGSAKAMGYKLWTLRSESEKYFDSWLKTETHYRALQKLGAEGLVQRHEPPAEMLRRLADAMEAREKDDTEDT